MNQENLCNWKPKQKNKKQRNVYQKTMKKEPKGLCGQQRDDMFDIYDEFDMLTRITQLAEAM